jgi:hypothetical protein
LETPCKTLISQSVIKYDGKTNTSVWLEDYQLAYKASGPDDDLLIIQFLPIYLANCTRAWQYHLSRNVINRKEDLREIFTDNFWSTYVHPGNSWNLKGYQQRLGESL